MSSVVVLEHEKPAGHDVHVPWPSKLNWPAGQAVLTLLDVLAHA